MDGVRSADGDTPCAPSLLDRLVDRGRTAMPSSPRPERAHSEWRRTALIGLYAAIGGCVATGSVALASAVAVERRVAGAAQAVTVVTGRVQDAAMLAERFRRPDLEARLTLLARMLPEDARLVLVEDRRITLRTTDPDRLRQQLRGAVGFGAYAERGQRMAPEGGVDVTLEERQ